MVLCASRVTGTTAGVMCMMTILKPYTRTKDTEKPHSRDGYCSTEQKVLRRPHLFVNNDSLQIYCVLTQALLSNYMPCFHGYRNEV
jgi:hypothetical protein